MSSTPTEGEFQDISPRGSTGNSITGPSSKGATTPKARPNSMAPTLQFEEEAKVRVETVVVGRQAKQARRDKLSKEEARVGESMDPMVHIPFDSHPKIPIFFWI